MIAKGSTVTRIVAIVLVLLLVLGAGGYFGYRYWVTERTKAAVVAAAQFQNAVWTQDTALLAALLPPDLVSAMSDADIEGVSAAWSLPCTLEDSGWRGDRFETEFSTQQWTGAEDTRVDLAAEYELPEATADAAVTIDVSFTITGDELPDSLNDTARVDMVWLDGAWRVARYRFEGTYSADILFHREGRSANKVLDALRETLGIGADGEGATGEVAAADDPAALVGSYYDAVIAGEYARAFAVLPDEKQSGWGDAATFGETIAGYGITGYTLSDARVDSSDDTTVITATATTVAGDFSWEWRLEDHGGKWTAVGYAIVNGDSGSGTAPALLPEELEQGELPAGHPDLGDSSD